MGKYLISAYHTRILPWEGLTNLTPVDNRHLSGHLRAKVMCKRERRSSGEQDTGSNAMGTSPKKCELYAAFGLRDRVSSGAGG